jgi:aminoglycoside 3-N-acetyltransferase I
MSWTIERITAQTHHLMAALNDVFAIAFEDDAHYTSRRPDAAYFQRILAKDDVIALVAIEGSQAVGGLVAYELHKLEQSRSEIYIYDLAVLESHRRKGMATALINELKRIAKVRGAWVIYVQADYGDEPAIALYTKLGVREDVMHFDLHVA